MAALEERILEAARSLSRINPLTPEAIGHNKDVSHLSAWSQVRKLKAVVEAARVFRVRHQFGKLRAAVLMGTTLLGDRFLVQAERAGILLAESAQGEEFSEFLIATSAR